MPNVVDVLLVVFPPVDEYWLAVSSEADLCLKFELVKVSRLVLLIESPTSDEVSWFLINVVPPMGLELLRISKTDKGLALLSESSEMFGLVLPESK